MFFSTDWELAGARAGLLTRERGTGSENVEKLEDGCFSVVFARSADEEFAIGAAALAPIVGYRCECV